MTVPDWRTCRAGARVRVALWLLSEVGEGGIFTKAQLREAFPNVEQIDRRMRDLRAEGWVIATYREDRSLAVDELRLCSIGAPVWSPQYKPRQSTAVTEKERQAIFAADNYRCVYCGMAVGEPYPDDPLRTAKLTLGRVQALGHDVAPQLHTVCDRCHVAVRDVPAADIGALLHAIAALDATQRERLRKWIHQGRRLPAPEEDLWARYQRLPHESRLIIQSSLTTHSG